MHEQIIISSFLLRILKNLLISCFRVIKLIIGAKLRDIMCTLYHIIYNYRDWILRVFLNNYEHIDIQEVPIYFFKVFTHYCYNIHNINKFKPLHMSTNFILRGPLLRMKTVKPQFTTLAWSSLADYTHHRELCEALRCAGFQSMFYFVVITTNN